MVIDFLRKKRSASSAQADTVGAARSAQASSALAEDRGASEAGRGERAPEGLAIAPKAPSHGLQGAAEQGRATPVARQAQEGSETPGPRRPEGGRATSFPVAEQATRSGPATKPEASAQGANEVARPHDRRPPQVKNSEMAGAAETQKKRGSEIASISGDLGASSAVYRDARNGERSEIAEPHVLVVSSMLCAEKAPQHASVVEVFKQKKKKLKETFRSSKNELGDARTTDILHTLLRHGCMIPSAIYRNVVDKNGFPTRSSQESFANKLRQMENKNKLIVSVDIYVRESTKKNTTRNKKAETKSMPQPDKKAFKLKLIRLTKKGAEHLSALGIKDVFGRDPVGYDASKVKVTNTWRHATIVSLYIASIADEYDYITDHELGKVCRIAEVKYPDVLIRLKGTTGAWVAVEVEHMEKNCGWWDRQCRMIAMAHDTGYRLADRWDVYGAQVVTTTKKQSPTLEDVGEGISAFAVTSGAIPTHIYAFDKYMNALSRITKDALINPRLAPEKVKRVETMGWGPNYVDALNEAHEQREYRQRNGYNVDEVEEDVHVMTVAYADFQLFVYCTQPKGERRPMHFAHLNHRGRRVCDWVPLGNFSGFNNDFRMAVIRACLYGSGREMPDMVEVVGKMSRQGTLKKFKELVEAVRWHRKDGRSLRQIADEYDEWGQ